ncbi:SPOR domain-containing protein [Rhodoferax sp.]|jgi:cell division protein FtsN|uniref:SPOR domain-containing protein n=2 Tax=Rhodoferax sp. TaxID=50421 RepID=UPI0027267C6A|nr:SPOR domain-containing protein [Rhodoferax sp.]MDO9144684.1 SPOR domain-containing protein [Rhodoferax sp.]MDP1530789.1 SPOR domain-containing protein [Rhodoferax sp.]MDP1945189.1 SPOR domain-containing protein [Rhodoferax sp.]MDP2442918.1 SPOR domain-containing protein [Rhodoferax sp.]MDP3191130.1 SPOR domain-containing protein [Rhodoferax sp.]
MKQQRGGTFLGFILGLLVGLGLALAVAVYVTKVPMVFFNKAASSNATQDANELEKNKNWDPNAPLYGKNPAKPAVPADIAVTPPAANAPENKPAVSADPLGDLVKARAKGSAASTPANTPDPFTYFIQVGAFRTPEDAQAQRAKLSLSGIETRISEREQSGRTVYRVRMGPFDKREEADAAKARLDGAGIETALVRVQR